MASCDLASLNPIGAVSPSFFKKKERSKTTIESNSCFICSESGDSSHKIRELRLWPGWDWRHTAFEPKLSLNLAGCPKCGAKMKRRNGRRYCSHCGDYAKDH